MKSSECRNSLARRKTREVSFHLVY